MPSIKHTRTPLFTLVLLFFTTYTSAQGPAPAPAPSAPGPVNITRILVKAGGKAGNFATFIRLLKATNVGDQIDNQLNNSNNGMTVFAPTDNAWSALPPGTLNKLNSQQKVEVVQFHVLPELITMSQFDTESNPLRTQAGDAMRGQFPLNVTVMGTQVNVSTGLVNATVNDTVYSDDQLAIYHVDQVLLPLAIFGSPAPAAAPAEAKKKKKKSSSTADAPTASDEADTTSAGVGLSGGEAFGGSIVAAVAVASFWWAL